MAVALTVSTPAFSSVCSAAMMHSTATAKRPPRARSSSSSSGSGASLALGRRANAIGTTTRLTKGAAAMPSATKVCPDAIPIATATANSSREKDSMKTSPP